MNAQALRRTLTMGLIAVAAGIASAQSATQGTSSTPAPFAHLASGDDVVVTVFREKELSARVFVDDADQVVLPKVGVLDVGRLTSDMLRDTIRARYATFLRDPSVDVRALRRVTVNGAVLKPDVYYVDPSMALRDVIARAGGVTSEGSMKDVSIIRGGVKSKYPNWSETAQGQTELRSGDQVLVGRRSWLSLNIGAAVGIAGLLTSLLIAFKH